MQTAKIEFVDDDGDLMISGILRIDNDVVYDKELASIEKAINAQDDLLRCRIGKLTDTPDLGNEPDGKTVLTLTAVEREYLRNILEGRSGKNSVAILSKLED